MQYNVLLLGSGGREHALAWAISKSPLLGELFIAPGNPGTAQCGTNVSLPLSDFDGILEFIQQNQIHLTVVGPEQPLVEGLADFLEDECQVVFGPKKAAAMLEGSKEFAKAFMQRHEIPTADYAVFSSQEYEKAEHYIRQKNTYPVVLKADGLAAGKGVLIPETEEEARSALQQLGTGSLKEAASRVVIEEFMAGEEASVFAVCDGEHYKIIGNAQDHKRIGEGDTGPNTGGMGAYSPAPIVSDDMMHIIEERIIKPTVQGMLAEGTPYQGILYVGLMITEEGPKVVEYNCRFGDPECQVIVPSLTTDILELIVATTEGKLKTMEVLFDGKSRCTVVLASEGYPYSYEKGKEITGVDLVKDALVFHAGTKEEQDTLYTNGGRVLNVVGAGNSLSSAIEYAYSGIDSISFEGAYHRKDIGKKGLAHLR
ncbi:MAG: phosphoribosylamine--glycine ligase [Bacteroidota bacterium]